MTDPITIAIVDDDPIVRRSLWAMLHATPGIRPIASFDDGTPAIAYSLEHHVDVYLVDVNMTASDGYTTTTQLRSTSSTSKVIILTSITAPMIEDTAKSIGAAAFLRKTASPSTITSTIRAVHEGTFDADTLRTQPVTLPKAPELTEREMEVLDGLRQGLSNQEIADNLFISNSAVKKHITSLLVKLEARSRLEIVITAVELGMVSLNRLNSDRLFDTTEY
ncbi:response regulator transcription factor [Acidipropionibacterium virtanenii]|uniref:Transcriptional regulatory protein LiaR n=1 Tax=Acidipropionibacterium virtanenii TaxID=2057246 RepID=A0A344UVI8_9ACTN|nr:response regulator transcription factor [Acidipropionibacterium virtanenii]AXE39286.1 Transcriptional regulatory protein LiaR [Acidipropionibacterium virtanenii]